MQRRLLGVVALVIAFGTFGSLGCALRSTKMKQWIGEDHAILVSQWGPPLRTAPLPDGSTANTYERQDRNGMGIPYTCTTTFVVSAKGKILRYTDMGCGRFD